LEADSPSNPHPEAKQHIGLAVDDLRRSLWAVLTTAHAADSDVYLSEVRVRRASEICSEILADLYADGLSAQAPGIREFRAWVHGLRAGLRRST
jgi:hypothetical protein